VESIAIAMDESRSPRFFRWIASLIFSIITLGSLVEVLKDEDYQPDSIAAERWAVGSAATKFIITVLVVCFHLNPITSILIIGTKIEGAITLVITILWIITVAIVTDSSHGIAVDEYGAVQNGNLFYFSWAGFVTAVTLLVSYLQHVFGLDVAGEIRARSARLLPWSALLASSIVVMGSSANYYDAGCGGDGQDEAQSRKCNRAVFGMVLGALTTLGSVGVVGLKIATSKAPFLLEAGGSLGSVVLHGFGVVFITSQQGPGAPLGNLYYFTWASFLVSFLLFTSCFEDYNAAATADAANTTTNASEENVDSAPNHVIQEHLEH